MYDNKNKYKLMLKTRSMVISLKVQDIISSDYVLSQNVYLEYFEVAKIVNFLTVTYHMKTKINFALNKPLHQDLEVFFGNSVKYFHRIKYHTITGFNYVKIIGSA